MAVPKLKKLSIIIPTFNEARTLKQVIENVFKAKSYKLKKEVIVINDGSTDQTKRLLASLKRKYRKQLIILHMEQNKGKGAAVIKGISSSTGDIVIIQDSDLEYGPIDFPRLLSPLIKGKADVVFGSRFQSSEEHRVLYFWHTVLNQLLTLLSNMCNNLNLTDVECGYKVFKGELIRRLAKKMASQRFGFEPEVVALCARVPRIRIYEVGVSYAGRTYEEGKHIQWHDGVRAIFEILIFNLWK